MEGILELDNKYILNYDYRLNNDINVILCLIFENESIIFIIIFTFIK